MAKNTVLTPLDISKIADAKSFVQTGRRGSPLEELANRVGVERRKAEKLTEELAEATSLIESYQTELTWLTILEESKSNEALALQVEKILVYYALSKK